MKTSKHIIFLIITLFLLFINKAFSSDPESLKENTNETFLYDVIIVPGVPYNDPNMSKILLGRIYWSHYLYTNGIAKNIIYSGSAVYTPYVEAEIMALYAQKLGVPAENIFTEPQAEHSVENVYYSYKIAKNLGFKRIALATDPFQSRMLKRFERKQNIQIEFIPFSFDFVDSLLVNNIEIIPDKAYVNNFVALHERESFFKRLRGTLGKNINYHE